MALILFSCSRRWSFPIPSLILAITAKQRFKMNQFTALAIGFALVYPNNAVSFTAENRFIHFFAGTPPSDFSDFRSPQLSFQHRVSSSIELFCQRSFQWLQLLLGWSQDWKALKIFQMLSKSLSKIHSLLFDYSATGLSGYRSNELSIWFSRCSLYRYLRF